MTTTREKFRARRAARIFQGRHWKPAQIRRMTQAESPPLVFNQIWLSREELGRIYPRPRAEFMDGLIAGHGKTTVRLSPDESDIGEIDFRV